MSFVRGSARRAAERRDIHALLFRVIGVQPQLGHVFSDAEIKWTTTRQWWS
jgi:hypothetical protein